MIELVKLHLSRRNGCAFSSEFHGAWPARPAWTRRWWRPWAATRTPAFAGLGRCLLRHAELINALADAQALAPTTAELSLHLCREHLVLVAMACAQINAWNRLGAAWHDVGRASDARRHAWLAGHGPGGLKRCRGGPQPSLDVIHHGAGTDGGAGCDRRGRWKGRRAMARPGWRLKRASPSEALKPPEPIEPPEPPEPPGTTRTARTASPPQPGTAGATSRPAPSGHHEARPASGIPHATRPAIPGQFSPQAQAYLQRGACPGRRPGPSGGPGAAGASECWTWAAAFTVAFHCAQAGGRGDGLRPGTGHAGRGGQGERPNAGWSLRTVQALAEGLPFEDGQFDQVFTRFRRTTGTACRWRCARWHACSRAAAWRWWMWWPESPLADTALQTLEMLRGPPMCARLPGVGMAGHAGRCRHCAPADARA